MSTESLPAPTPEVHGAHRDVTGGWLRPAVFGAMDGLVSNFALLSGVVGGGASHTTIVLTGMAGLVAGACSMAAGEYVSVTSQSELVASEIEIEKRELERNPEAEMAELAGLYRQRGLDPSLADEVARQLSAQPEHAWRIHVREELGVDPDDLPSGLVAAASSFLAFAVGALIPLMPFLFGADSDIVALVISAIALFVSGAVVARLTAVNIWFGGLRQLLLGAAAAAVTFGIGHLVGVGLG